MELRVRALRMVRADDALFLSASVNSRSWYAVIQFVLLKHFMSYPGLRDPCRAMWLVVTL